MLTDETSATHACLPLLADPGTYRACETDLLTDDEAQRYWLDVFGSHTTILLDAAIESGYDRDAVRAAGRAWADTLESLRRRPGQHGRLDILLLDELRRAVLDRHGIHDEFRALKARENERAMRQLPDWLQRVDSMGGPSDRLELIVRGMLAGNLFDMGVPEMVRHYGEQAISFEDALRRVPSRPWLIDDFDRACEWLTGAQLGKAVVFVDNAGGDFVLGVIPLTRFLLDRCSDVILAANAAPSHNDVTVAEVRELLQRAAAHDPRVATDCVQVLSNGHAAPLIDLRCVSRELADASADADLVVLIGMGRSVESNLTARFTCAAWKIAMIKDAIVARTVGGKNFDAVCRFEHPQ